MKISALLTTMLFAAGMVWGQSSGMSQENTNKQAQTKKSTPREKVEHATKTTPSAKTKSTTVRVVGRVSSFESGKKLAVTTPKKGHRSFDLSAKNTTVNGAENVKPGEMVRVTEKTENGQHTINIEPYTSARAHHAKKQK